MATKRDIVQTRAIEIIKLHPDGIRWAELVQKLTEDLSSIPRNTIRGILVTLDSDRPNEIYKPEKGLFSFKDAELPERPQELSQGPEKIRVKEKDFYESFAAWLVGELQECTEAIALGGNKFGDKWGTPDVVGIRKLGKRPVIEFLTEIVSAEIKLDKTDLIKAFGQACAYMIFSHKCYLVVPKSSSEGDIGRLDALCRIFGIGLVLYESTKPDEPDFEIRARAMKREPDIFYVERYIKLVANALNI